MKKILVTGGSGKTGRAVIRHLLEHGYEVVNADRMPAAAPVCPQLLVDLSDYGQTVEALAGVWGVVHLAAIPGSDIHPPLRTFEENLLSTAHVFQAAVLHKVARVVWASSETVQGIPFERVQPEQVPIDEAHAPFPETCYALSKSAAESLADQYARWSGIPFAGLRFSNVMELSDYARFAGWQHDPAIRRWNLWSYVDARDAAQGCRLSLEAPLGGSEIFLVAAADTVMERPNAELLAAVLPGTRLADGTASHETLLSIHKARRVLGYAPQFSWRTSG